MAEQTWMDAARFDRIEALLETLLQKYTCSQSSSHGAANSFIETRCQPIQSKPISPMAESSQEIRELCTSILAKLQEEIDASESLNVSLPASDEFPPAKEPIEAQSITDDEQPRGLSENSDELPRDVIDGGTSRNHCLSLKSAFSFVLDFESLGESVARIREPQSNQPRRGRRAQSDEMTTTDVGNSNKLVEVPQPLERNHCRRRTATAETRSVRQPPEQPKPPDWTYCEVANPPPPPEPPDLSCCIVAAILVAEEYDHWFVFGDVADTLRNLSGEAQGQSNGTPTGLLDVIRDGGILCFCVSVLPRKKIKLKMKKKSLSIKLKTPTITSNFKWFSPQNDMVLLSNHSVSSFGLFTTLDVSLVFLAVIQLSSYTVLNDLIMIHQNMHHLIELNGRLRDFGLARLYNHGTDPQTTHVIGTLGCLAPNLGTEYRSEEVELVFKLCLLCSHFEPLTGPSICQVVQYLEWERPSPDLNLKLVGYHTTKGIIAASGGVHIILDLIFSPQNGTFIIIKCSSIHEKLSSDEDGIDFLVNSEGKQLELDSIITNLLTQQQCSNSGYNFRKPALHALLGNFKFESGSVKKAILAANGVSLILSLLDDSDSEIRGPAIQLLFLFSQHGPEGVVECLLKPTRLEALIGFLENDDKHDIGTRFGHFGIVDDAVAKIVKLIRANGGKIPREPGPIKGGYNKVIAFIEYLDEHIFELLERDPSPNPPCQVMLRVGDLHYLVAFYEKLFGIGLLHTRDKQESKYTITMLGHGPSQELTSYYGVPKYDKGHAYTQLAIDTNDVYLIAGVDGKIPCGLGPSHAINKILFLIDKGEIQGLASGFIGIILGILLGNCICCSTLFVHALFTVMHWEDVAHKWRIDTMMAVLNKSEATWKDTTITQQHCLSFNLEDKVDFNGGGNVMISIEKCQVSKRVVTEKARKHMEEGVRG